MYRNNQYLSNESFKGVMTGLESEKSSCYNLQDMRQRSITGIGNHVDSYAEQRLMQIKKKHGIKDKTTKETYESKPLQDITLRSSNYNTFKSTEKDQKSKSSSLFKSVLINHPNTNTNANPQARVSGRVELKASQRKDFRESIVSRVDEIRDIPKFGGSGSKWETINVSKSIQVPVPAEEVSDKDSRDKIKEKFNHILNCFNDNNLQKRLEKYRPEYLQQKELTKPEPVESIKAEIFRSKVFVETNDDAFNKYYVPGKSSNPTDTETKPKRSLSSYSPLENAKARCSYLPSQGSAQETSAIKIRNVDEEIRKIQERIRKSHEEKKKLDINEIYRQTPDIPRRLSCYSKSPIDKSVMANRRQLLYNNVPPIRLRTEEWSESDHDKLKPSDRIRESQRNKPSSRLYTEDYTSKLEIPLSRNRVPTAVDVETERGESARYETNKLVEHLKTQVELDQKLRNSKVILSHTNMKNKWSEIKQILQKNKIFMSDAEIQSQFDVTIEQHNPFFSVRESTQTFSQVVQKYLASHRHWNSSIFRSYDAQTLRKEGFTEQSIDLQKKGNLTIQDLVRFLNFKTKNFYRNRDLVLLFRRITPNSSTTFKGLMDAISRV